MRPVNFTHYTPIIPFPGRGRIAISRALARHVITRCPRRREWADEEGTLRPGVCVCCTPLRTAVHPRARAHAAVLISTFLAFSFPIRPYRRARARAHIGRASADGEARNARGVYRFYRQTSVFTFRYNYALMCGATRARRKRFRVIHAIDVCPLPSPPSPPPHPPAEINTLDMPSDLCPFLHASSLPSSSSSSVVPFRVRIVSLSRRHASTM